MVSPMTQALGKSTVWSARSAIMIYHCVAPVLAFVMTTCVMTFAITFSASNAAAQSLVQPPAPQSPHWSHINIFDFGRSLYLAFPSATQRQWMSQHLDAVEVSNNMAAVQQYNSTIAMSSYQTDMSILQSTAGGLTDESFFLHFSEPTTIQMWNLAKTAVVNTMTIQGCPGTPTPSCRVQNYLWSDYRYIFYLPSPTLRPWLANRVLGPTNTYGTPTTGHTRVWIDEHAPGFQWPLSFGYQNVVIAGGMIKEFGIRAQDPAIDGPYNQTVVDWLTYLKTQADAAGQKVLINANNQVNNSYIVSQESAIKGFDTESYFEPDLIVSPADFAGLATRVNTAVAGGGWVSLHGTWGDPVPGGYTNGNYSSVTARAKMWRLAGYYLLRERPGAGQPGIVYFNPRFGSNNPPFDINGDIAAWLNAYQVSPGLPTGSMYTHQTGTAGGVAYTIYGRAMEKATVLLRPRDCSSCTNYGDSSAATVTFASPVQVLKEDGTLGPQTSTVSIRNAEAVILFKNDSVPPATPQNLKVF
jgi:hypothetical protein